jgi:hypothetical protein
MTTSHLIGYKHCVKDIPFEPNRDEPKVFESIFFPSIALVVWFIAKRSSPLGVLFVLMLGGYFSCRICSAYEHAQAIKDNEQKKNLIEYLKSQCFYALSKFLVHYHPDWYPPPINKRIAAATATYATFIRELYRAHGSTPTDEPDHVLIHWFGTYQGIFPTGWNYERAYKFTQHIFEVLEMLWLSSLLTIEENREHETLLTALFNAQSDAEKDKILEKLPPHITEKFDRAFDVLYSSKENTILSHEIEQIDARLTTLIPDYIAKTKTVIGTPPEGLPVAYESLESRYRHSFLIGRSGAGKSTVITNLVAQDIHRGYGVIVMSPDEDLMRRIVPYIPEHRLDDVIYFDPTDTTLPMIGFNPFYFEPPDNPRDYQLLKSRKAGETYTILERTLGLSTQEGMQTLLNNAMHALIGRPTASINELRRLLDPKERALHREVANDPDVDDYTREYWETYASEGANALVYRNLTRRMANLLRPPLFDIFSTHSLSFHREINERARIVLLDLSNFPRDSMEAKITSQLMIATVQQTILRRDKIRKEDYIPYFMYIDEFQNFADTNEKSIGDMAEQLRKYSFGLTLTSLVASDLSGRLFDTIIGVMSTFICLSMSAKDARRFADEMSLKHSGNGEFSYESLQKLRVGQAFVKTPPLDTAVFVQMPREPVGNLPKGTITLQQLKNRSKANFGAIGRHQESAAVDREPENEHVAEPPDIPLATQLPRREPPKKTPSQPPRSKTPHKTPADESPSVDPKTQPEREADLFDTPQAPEPQTENIPLKKEPPRPPAKRKRRNRFDEDAGNPEIEVC